MSIAFDRHFGLRRLTRARHAPPPAHRSGSSVLSSVELHRAARAFRSALQARLLASMLRALGATLRRAYSDWQRRNHARAVQAALSKLDPWTLHDLGFERSEISSVAAELSGSAELTRMRTGGPR
jgi:uncharacterized protein YjiS (DUF1127 family)